LLREKAAVRSGLFLDHLPGKRSNADMTNRVLLNNIDHLDLRVVPRHGPEFGDAVNQTLIVPTEFEEAQRDYPILFKEDAEGQIQAVALLGLDRDENLFLGTGGWQARYIPALHQRGPFSIALKEQEIDGERVVEPMIHIDLDDPRVSSGEGYPLFRPQGGNAPYLEHIARVLRAIHEGLRIGSDMYDAFQQAGLIEPANIEIQLSDTEQYNLPNHFAITAEGLARLNESALWSLHRAGFLRSAFLIASSLGNVARLIELKNQRRTASLPSI
jgi:hypothetical protein